MIQFPLGTMEMKLQTRSRRLFTITSGLKPAAHELTYNLTVFLLKCMLTLSQLVNNKTLSSVSLETAGNDFIRVLLSCVRCTALLQWHTNYVTEWPCSSQGNAWSPWSDYTLLERTHTHTHSDTHHQCRDSKSDNLVCVCVFVWSLLTLISQRLYCEFKWAHLRFSPSHWLFLTSLLYQYSNHPIQHKCRHSSIVHSNMDRNFFQLSARKSWFTVTRLLYRHKQQTNFQQINHEDVKLGTDMTPSRSLSSENQKKHQ